MTPSHLQPWTEAWTPRPAAWNGFEGWEQRLKRIAVSIIKVGNCLTCNGNVPFSFGCLCPCPEGPATGGPMICMSGLSMVMRSKLRVDMETPLIADAAGVPTPALISSLRAVMMAPGRREREVGTSMPAWVHSARRADLMSAICARTSSRRSSTASIER